MELLLQRWQPCDFLSFLRASVTVKLERLFLVFDEPLLRIMNDYDPLLEKTKGNKAQANKSQTLATCD